MSCLIKDVSAFWRCPLIEIFLYLSSEVQDLFEDIQLVHTQSSEQILQ